MSDNYKRLYVFVRNDLDSMTLGKIAAQVHHAGTHLIEFSGHTEFVKSWKENRGFGTTLVMRGGDTEEIFFNKMNQYTDDYWNYPIAGIIEDPSYPVKDGNKVHLIPLITCFYVMTDHKLVGENLL